MTAVTGDGFDVRSLAVTYREGHVLTEHTHPWAQLVYARSGLMYVEAEQRICFVPPTKALWLPPRITHRITFRGEVAMRTLYLSDTRAATIPRSVETLGVSPLLAYLIQHIQSLGMLDPKVAEHEHLACVLTDLISAAPSLDMMLPQPRDKRAVRLANQVRTHPDDKRSLGALSRDAGASLRTMQRYFVVETGLTLAAWRQKARLIHSVASLCAGASVADAAADCGYESSSAYVAAFKQQFEVTPGRFDRRRQFEDIPDKINHSR